MRRRTRVSSRLGSKWMSERPLLEGVAQDVVEGLDHRRGGGVELVASRGQELLVPEVDASETRLARELLLGGLQAGLEVVEALVDRLHVAAGGHHPLHVEAGHPLDVLVGEGREGVVDGDGDGVRRSSRSPPCRACARRARRGPW